MMERVRKCIVYLGMLVWLSATAAGAVADSGFDSYNAMARYEMPVIDGKLGTGEWDMAFAKEMYKFDKDDHRITLMFQYDTDNLYIAMEVGDSNLWDDPSGDIWANNQSDSVEIYIDADNSRDSVLQDSDRVIAFSAGGNHYRFDTGNNAGSTKFYAEISKIQRAVSINGTLNNISDTDTGYIVETAVPWNLLGISPLLASDISVNIVLIEGNDGTLKDDERYFKWSGDGLKGPANYARICLLSRNDTTPPAAVQNLSAQTLGSSSAMLSFTTPGDNSMNGQAAAYLIRYRASNAIVSEADWNAAFAYENAFVPKLAGTAEKFKISGLKGNTLYHFSVRAKDAAGNIASLSNSASLRTDAPRATASSAKNGYYHKDTSENFVFYDAMAKFGTPAIDGKSGVGEWDLSLAEDIYKYDRDDNRIRMMFQYDSDNLYFFIQVDDDYLWDDSAGETYKTGNDDGIEIYIDPDNSRDAVLQDSDRVIAFSVNGNHYRFDRGKNEEETQYYGKISAIKRAVGIDGTVNDSSDKDKGYIVEVAVPWHHIGVKNWESLVGKPVSVNILVVEDDNGGEVNVSYNEDVWDRPFEIDRFFNWFGDGLKGPANYARLYLLPPSDTTAPSRISDLSVANMQPYSCIVSFTSPGDNGWDGQAVSYLIRYRTEGAIVSEDDWNNALVYENSFMSKICGNWEELRILGLSDAKIYHIAVRAKDYAGNLGPISNSVSFSTPVAAKEYGKGRIYASPKSRYFLCENGTPFLPVTQPGGITWLNIRDLYTLPVWDAERQEIVNWSNPDFKEVGNAEKFVQGLSEKGINLFRIFIEDLAFANKTNSYFPDGVAFLAYPATVNENDYIDETLKFLDDFLNLCAQYDIYVTLTPFDNYFYKTYWDYAAFNSANGGPISSSDEFVSSAFARTVQKKYIEVLYNVVKNHSNFFGWEMMNEWDNDTFAQRDADWDKGKTVRIEWIKELLAYLRSIDKESMIFVSSVEWQPQFDRKDFVLLSDYFDFVGIHNYTKAVKEPPLAGDSDPTIRPALDSGRLIRYMTGNTADRRPVFDLEFGPIDIEAYSARYSEKQDEETFHNILWAEFAAGAAGMPMRWPGKPLEDRGPTLTDTMWDYQANMADFFAKTRIKFDSLAGVPWERNISLSGTKSDSVNVFASSDGRQGLVYLLHDARKSSGTVGGLAIAVSGLFSGFTYHVEFWDTRAENGKIEETEAVSENGVLRMNLPSFKEDMMMTFSTPEDELPPVSVKQMEVSPKSYSFGNVNSGETSSAQTFTVKNTGNSAVKISTVTLAGTETSAFRILNDKCSGQTIAASGSGTFDVVFSPASLGKNSASIQISSDDPEVPKLNVSLTGNGTKRLKSYLTADFGANGLYLYDGAQWKGIVGWNPEKVITWDFGANGLWLYDGGAWTGIVNWDAEDTVVWGSRLVADFGANGIYAYNGSSWTWLNSLNPEQMIEWNGKLVADFGANGIYAYDGSSWTGLRAWNPENMIEWNGKLAADFGANGLWIYDGSTWTGVVGWNAENMTVWNGRLAAGFGADGLYVYDGSTWAGLAGWSPENMVVWKDRLAADFGLKGLWLYDGSRWTGIVGWDAENLLAWGDRLAAGFGFKGLWLYDGASWSGITGWNCGDMKGVDF